MFGENKFMTKQITMTKHISKAKHKIIWSRCSMCNAILWYAHSKIQNCRNYVYQYYPSKHKGFYFCEDCWNKKRNKTNKKKVEKGGKK